MKSLASTILLLCLISGLRINPDAQSSKGRVIRQPKRTAEEMQESRRAVEEIIADIDAGWKSATSSEHYVYTYNSKSITHTTHTVKVWFKESLKFPLAQGRAELIKQRKGLGLHVTGYNRYNHTLTLTEFNCKDKVSRTLRTTDYDDLGNALSLGGSNEFTPVRAKTVGEGMMKVACAARK